MKNKSVRIRANPWFSLLVTVLLAAALVCTAAAQHGSETRATQSQPTPTNPPPQAKPAPKPEHRITPAEAKELLNSVDEVLKFDSEASGLPIKHTIKRQLADRAQVQKYIEDNIRDDPDSQRLKKAQAVLKKFGLLPRNFDLEAFLVELMREQVAGYYDPKTKMVNLLDWLPPEQQLPVLAHELTHALQDQNFDLEKWMKAGTSDKTPEQEVDADEQIAARHAVVEGQGMVVMIDYLLAPTGASVVNSPLITQAIQQGMMQGENSPVFNRAPLFIKRVLLFPYSYGLDFERELLVKGGKERAYTGVLKHPPRNTRQVMEPATYLAGENLPPLPLPDFEKLLGKEYEKYDVGSIGEFDVAAIVEQFAGEAQAKKIYPNWRGGYYYAARKKNAAGEDLALVFVTKWASAAAAKEFAEVYGSTFEKRYKVTAPGRSGSTEGCSPHGNCIPSGGTEGFYSETTEGRVSLHRIGETVIAVESVPAEIAGKVRDAIVGAVGRADSSGAKAPRNDKSNKARFGGLLRFAQDKFRPPRPPAHARARVPHGSKTRAPHALHTRGRVCHTGQRPVPHTLCTREGALRLRSGQALCHTDQQLTTND